MVARFSAFQLRPFLFVTAFLISFTLLCSLRASAWGGRGHALICKASIHLIQDPQFKRFMMGKIQGLTYLCNVPDIHWRNIKSAASGNSSHFFQSDLIGLPLESVPLDFKEVKKAAQGKPVVGSKKTVKDPERELGSSWWRADQFYRLALAAGKKAQTSLSAKKKGSKDSPDVFEMWVMMGLMGHFVGDNAQPFHTTKDYDGWDVGHGGFHSFYETDLVNALSHEALTAIIAQAGAVRKELALKKDDSAVAEMKRLSILSHKDISVLLSKDPLIKKSQIKKERGMSLKTEAERKPAHEVIDLFQPLLITHLARAAVLLAHQWDRIYEVSGKPALWKDHSFLFPHQYSFVPLDY